MFNLKPLSFLIATLTLTACGSSSDDVTPIIVEEPPVVVEEPGPFTFFLQTSGDANPEYLITQEELNVASLSADGTGVEQQGWNFVFNVGNTVFISGYENFEALSYKVDADGNVAPLASFVFDNALEMFSSVDDSVLLASDEPRDGAHTARTLYTVDANTGLITDKINYTIFNDDTGTPGEGSVGWATALVVRDNLLYVPFHKLDDQAFFTTPDPDNAYVAIYDYPLTDGAAPNKIISDNRASNIGVNGSASSMITADNGDLYTLSSGAASVGFSPASTLPSAILRINNSETEFDPDYYFNVADAPNGGILYWFDYIGDNKVIARVITDETITDPETGEDSIVLWSAFGKGLITQKLVIIDLLNQTVTDVAGVPLHSKQYTGPVEVIDGKVYVSIENAESDFVYEVDIATSTAVVGAEIEGLSIKGFYDLYH